MNSASESPKMFPEPKLSSTKPAGQPVPGKEELNREFNEALNDSFWEKWPEDKRHRFLGKPGPDGAPDKSVMGVRYLVRTMYALLRTHRHWTKADLADLIYDLVREDGRGLDTVPARIEHLFLGSAAQAKEAKYDPAISNRLAAVWWRIGERGYHGKPPLEFDRGGDFANRKWSKPSELYDEVENRVKAAETRAVAARTADPWLDGLDEKPGFGTLQLPSHAEALKRLFEFATFPERHEQVFTLVGEPLSGKTTLLKKLVFDLKDRSVREASPAPCILHLDLTELRSFESVVSRINNFLDAQGDAGRITWSDDTWSGSIEMKLRSIAAAAVRLGRSALFLMNGVPATVQSGVGPGGHLSPECLLHDDRLDRLVEFLTTLNRSNRVVLAVSSDPDARGSARAAGLGSRPIDFTLPDLSIHQLKVMLKSFAEEHGLSEDELGALIGDLNKPLAKVPVQAGRVGGRFLMSALALLWLAQKQTRLGDEGVLEARNADHAVLIEAASSETLSVKPLLARIYQRLRNDPHGRIVVALLAFSEGGVQMSGLADLLRHHRQVFKNSAIADVPEGCSGLRRSLLCGADVERVTALTQRLRFLVSERKPRRSGPELNERSKQVVPGGGWLPEEYEQSDAALDPVLEINKVLRPTLCEVIEEADPELSSGCHLILARYCRRQSMRARLSRPGIYGATLDDLVHDFSVLEHLLSSARPSAPDCPAPLVTGENAHDDEWRVFTAFDSRPSTVLRFAAEEVLAKDIDLGPQHRMTSVLQADDVVVNLMKRFFHLGRSAPVREQDDQNFLIEGIECLLEKLPVSGVVPIATKLAVAALQRHDFATLWPAMNLEVRLHEAGASPVDLLRLRLVRLDALMLVGQLRWQPCLPKGVAVPPEPPPGAEDLATRWLHEACCPLPNLPDGWRPEDTQTGAEQIDTFANSASHLDPEMLWACGKLLARLGEIAHLTTAGPLALWRFAQAEALAVLAARAGMCTSFPLLSGTSGRGWLAALLAYAGRNRKDPAGFNWAKAHAEVVHRHNLRRLGVSAIERVGAVIDEAALERQVRGVGGAGDLERAHQVLEGAYANALEASAPATIRFEFTLERARCAMYLGELWQQDGRESDGERLTGNARLMAEKLANRINGRYTAVHKAPVYHLSEAYAIAARCSGHTTAQSEGLKEQSKNIKQAYGMLVEEDGFTVVDPRRRNALHGSSWQDESLLA